MSSLRKSVQIGGFTALFALISIAMPVSMVSAYSNNKRVPGNNGTLKVHEQGTPSATRNNDPKVCVFNFEGFGFDAGQTGYIQIKPQGGSKPVGEAVGPISFGATNTDGYAETQYFNTKNGVTVKNGTYKATLYGKDTAGSADLKDVKAKSKVFKVNCEDEQTPEKPVVNGITPRVTFTQPTCELQGTYVLHAVQGVQYYVNDVATDPGTYSAENGTTVVVTAKALKGYKVEAEFKETKKFVAPAAEDCVLSSSTGTGSTSSTSTELANTGVNNATMISTVIGVILFGVTALLGLATRKQDDVTYYV